MLVQTTMSLLCLVLLQMIDKTNAFLSQGRYVIETFSAATATTAATTTKPEFPKSSFSYLLFSTLSCDENDEISSPEEANKNNNATIAIMEKEVEEASSTALSQALLLKQQAQRLREEANAQAKALQEEKERQLALQNSKIDSWIDDLLIQYKVNDDTQLLHSVDQVLCRLRDDRYSKEQVRKIFKRICETGPPQSRSRCSPIMELFVDAVGKLDEVERDENPNKRWSGKIERELRKKLFAMDWGFELPDDDDDDERNPWKLR